MAQGRTGLGTGISGSVSDTITVADVAGIVGRTLLIAVLGHTGDPESVVWGSGAEKQEATKLYTVNQLTANHTLSVWQIKYCRATLTMDMVAEWAATNSERAIMVEMIEEGTVVDVSSSNPNQDSTTAPTTGTSVNTTVADTLHIAFFGSDGRSSDSDGTIGDGHTAGQRVATVAAGMLLKSTYEDLSAIGGTRSSLSGTTSRNWCAIVVALKKRQTYTVKACASHQRTMNEEPDWVEVIIEDESGNGFTQQLDPVVFDDMSDAEFTAWMRRLCSIWTDNILDDDYVPVADTARNTRMATFVNDEIVI